MVKTEMIRARVEPELKLRIDLRCQIDWRSHDEKCRAWHK